MTSNEVSPAASHTLYVTDYTTDHLNLATKALSTQGFSVHWDITTPGQPPHDDRPMSAAENICVAHCGSFDGMLSSLPYGCAAACDVTAEWIAAFTTVWGDVAGPDAMVTHIPGASLERKALPLVVYYDLTGDQTHAMIEATKQCGREAWTPPRFVASIDNRLASALQKLVAAKPELEEGLAHVLMACTETDRRCDVAVYSPGSRTVAPSTKAGASGVVTVYPATGPLVVWDCPPELRQELESIAPGHSCVALCDQIMVDDALNELASLQNVPVSDLPPGLLEIATFADVGHHGDGHTPCEVPDTAGTMVVIHEPSTVEDAFLRTGSQYHPSQRTDAIVHDGPLQDLVPTTVPSASYPAGEATVEWLEVRNGELSPARLNITGKWLVTRVRDTDEAARLTNELAQLSYAPQ